MMPSTSARVAAALAVAAALSLPVLGVTPGRAHPPAPPPVFGKGFAVAAVTTDLHRRLVPGADAKSAAVVFVDGAAVFADPAKLDPAALDLATLEYALTAYRPTKEKAVHF